MGKRYKRRVENQVYEYYWDLTMAWTNFNGYKFCEALKITIDFIDNNKDDYSPEVYEKLQEKISTCLNIDKTSTRKGINELVKLGFINPRLKSYHSLSKEYLQTNDNENRKLLLSKIVYSNASFQRSVTKESNTREINFLVKTIEAQKGINEKYLGTIISIKTNDYPAGYITKNELEQLFRSEKQSEFEKRKYNQIGYLSGLLKKLDGIVFKDDVFYLKKDSNNIQSDDEQISQEMKGRDPYLQRIYKHQLEQESLSILGNVKCMVEKLSYPVLIASHIKPFRYSDEKEAFDPNNGLLLSKTLDSLFDLNYISFSDDGNIIFYNRVSEDVKEFWKNYKLDEKFINSDRLLYLKYHRDLCEKKNNCLNN